MRRSGFWILLFFALAGPAAAHPALYHYLEVNLLDAGEVPVYVTFHAPELIEGVVTPEDDLYGRDWLATRDDAVLAGLVENADRFAGEVFAFQFAEREVTPDFVFPDFATIRRPPPGSVVPDGCFSGAAMLPYTRGETELTIGFSDKAQKRLMLIINRPAAFPEVVDLEPGENYVLALPEAPIEEGAVWEMAAVLVGLLVILAVALIGWRRGLFLRKKNASLYERLWILLVVGQGSLAVFSIFHQAAIAPLAVAGLIPLFMRIPGSVER